MHDVVSILLSSLPAFIRERILYATTNLKYQKLRAAALEAEKSK
jgi:hypothetical protein